MIKGIIFDYGGTIDSRGDHWSYVIRDAWTAAGVAADTPVFRDCYVFAERELARTLHILPHHNFHDLLLIKMRIELQHLSEMGLLPPEDIEPKAEAAAKYCYDFARASVDDAKPVLEELSKKFPLVLVSNFYGNIETVLKDFGIDKYFPKIVESAVVGVRKPDPQIFRLGCEALGLPPEKVAVIGDSYSKDIAPARSLGCMAVWIKGRCWSDDEQQRVYTPTITSLSQLPALLSL